MTAADPRSPDPSRRPGVPDWVTGDSDSREATEELLGEQAEWGYAIPWVFRWLAAPPETESLPAPPQPGDHHSAATGYWSALLHVLIYSLGWARPDLGLRWWTQNGKPVDDPRLRLLAAYDADGMLELFTAWTATTQQLAPIKELADLTGYPGTDDRPPYRPGVLDHDQDRAAEQLGNLSPYSNHSGGWDPLHLSMHCVGPLEEPTGDPVIVRSGRGQRQAVLLLDSMRGWYRSLAEAGAGLPDIGDRSWRIDVVGRPFGHLGTYRRSRTTGLWFAGRHRHHLPGT